MRILLASHNRSLSALLRQPFSRFQYEWILVEDGLDAFEKILSGTFDLILLDHDLPQISAAEILRRKFAAAAQKSPPVIVFTVTEAQRLEIESKNYPRVEIIPRPVAIRDFVDRVRHILHQDVRAVCLGGGTGLFTLLSGLKTLAGINLTAIVSMSDDGGATGRLRDMFGILPPGDVRRSLVALSTAPDLVNELIQYRFDRGGELAGHNLGNLLITALCDLRGSMAEAVKSIGEILNIQGEVIPVTETVNTLKAELEDGTVVVGESRIDLSEGRDPGLRIRRLWQDPPARATAEALEAIAGARYIFLGPGDLFTSVISNFIVQGVSEAICSSRAKKIYVCNIMTEPGETTGFQAADHVREIVKYLGRDCLDFVLLSNTPFSAGAKEAYASQKQFPVRSGGAECWSDCTRARIIEADVASENVLVRHDSLKLASEIKKILEIQ
ncbi:MAG: uridine diphosphate-N-acetylglucosamine-binding protein YvcK [Candidatus Omnitrophica bacterium]|nr:uridine diphosphate-N-acetylglucosamine-binding protein YvcK [Candidatus Omnitrophota bacterium]